MPDLREPDRKQFSRGFPGIAIGAGSDIAGLQIMGPTSDQRDVVFVVVDGRWPVFEQMIDATGIGLEIAAIALKQGLDRDLGMFSLVEIQHRVRVDHDRKEMALVAP